MAAFFAFSPLRSLFVLQIMFQRDPLINKTTRNLVEMAKSIASQSHPELDKFCEAVKSSRVIAPK